MSAKRLDKHLTEIKDPWRGERKRKRLMYDVNLTLFKSADWTSTSKRLYPEEVGRAQFVLAAPTYAVRLHTNVRDQGDDINYHNNLNSNEFAGRMIQSNVRFSSV